MSISASPTELYLTLPYQYIRSSSSSSSSAYNSNYQNINPCGKVTIPSLATFNSSYSSTSVVSWYRDGGNAVQFTVYGSDIPDEGTSSTTSSASARTTSASTISSSSRGSVAVKWVVRATRDLSSTTKPIWTDLTQYVSTTVNPSGSAYVCMDNLESPAGWDNVPGVIQVVAETSKGLFYTCGSAWFSSGSRSNEGSYAISSAHSIKSSCSNSTSRTFSKYVGATQLSNIPNDVPLWSANQYSTTTSTYRSSSTSPSSNYSSASRSATSSPLTFIILIIVIPIIVGLGLIALLVCCLVRASRRRRQRENDAVIAAAYASAGGVGMQPVRAEPVTIVPSMSTAGSPTEKAGDPLSQTGTNIITLANGTGENARYTQYSFSRYVDAQTGGSSIVLGPAVQGQSGHINTPLTSPHEPVSPLQSTASPAHAPPAEPAPAAVAPVSRRGQPSGDGDRDSLEISVVPNR